MIPHGRQVVDAAPADERAALKEKLTKRFEEQTSIWRAVEKFGAEEMIDPRDTRKYLARLLALYYRMPLEGRAS